MLLVQVVPPAQREKVTDLAALQGPVVDPGSRSDVVKDQSEVDDLLASLGF